MKITNLFFNCCLTLSFRWQTVRFNRAISNPKKTQEKILFNILKENAKTVFGNKYDFSSIKSIAEFKEAIPLLTYDDYAPYIQLISIGKNNVLTKERVKILEPSSGSVAASKYIPYTSKLKSDFQRGLFPWTYNLFTNNKKMMFGKTYWSITPAASNNGKSTGNISIGFKEDSEYFGALRSFILQFLLVVPKEVSHIKDIDSFRYVTLLFLIKERNVSFISVWNPTFLTLLLKPLLKYNAQLVEDLEQGTINKLAGMPNDIRIKLSKKLSVNRKRAYEIKDIIKNHEERANKISLYEKIWPNLKVISCWGDAEAKNHLNTLVKIFPSVKVQTKGLMATEGIVSFPFFGEEGKILAVNSHFFEFVEIGKSKNKEQNPSKDTKLLHQLEFGKSYSVVITTSGGLYRYKLQDIIKVVGFKYQCPLIEFVSKEDKISDLFGEKINEYHVRSILNDSFEEYDLRPEFCMIAPEKDDDEQYCYCIFAKFDRKYNEIVKIKNNLINFIEKGLRGNYHYKYCRDLKQLSEVRMFLIDDDSDPSEVYLTEMKDKGNRLGNIKTSVLNKETGWAKRFKGSFV